MPQNRALNSKHNILAKTRFPEWFGAFLNSTDQKHRTGYLFTQIAKKLYPARREECRVLDIGAGEGTLAKKIAEGLKAYCNKLYYYGLEALETYARRANDTLNDLNITHANIQEGNFSDQEDLDKLPNNADIILASHIAYYANNVTKLVFDLVNKAKNDTVFLFLHQSKYSKIREWRKNYANHPSNTQEEINAAFKARGFNVLEFFHPALVKFPSHTTMQDVLHSYTHVLRQHFDPAMKELVNLLEFELYAPFEHLESIGALEKYLQDVKEVLDTQDNKLIVWDVLQIATKDEIKNTLTLQKTIESEAIPATILNLPEHDIHEPSQNSAIAKRLGGITIGTLTPFELACSEGNDELARELWPQFTSHYSEERPFSGLNLASRGPSVGHIKIVEFLLEKKEWLDLNIKSGPEEWTALHFASYFGRAYIVTLLLDAGVNIHVKDAAGRTALHIACLEEQGKIAQILWNHTIVSDEKLKIGELKSLIALVVDKQSMSNLHLAFSEELTALSHADSIPFTDTKYFVDRQGNGSSLDNVMEILNSKKGIVFGGFIGAGKSTLVIQTVREWVRKFGKKVYWFDPDYETSFYNSIEKLFNAFGISHAATNKPFTEETKEELVQKLREHGEECLFVFDNYFHAPLLFKALSTEAIRTLNNDLKKYSSNKYSNKISGIPNKVTMKITNQLLEVLFSVGNAKILITTRAKNIPWDKRLFRINLDPFQMKDITKYFNNYDYTATDNALLYKIENLFGAFPLQLSSIKKSLEYYKVARYPFDALIEENTKDPCIAVPIKELEPIIKLLSEPTSTLLIYMSYLGSNSIKFVNSIATETHSSIPALDELSLIRDSIPMLEELSFIELHNNNYVIQKDTSILVRNYFRCIDKEKLSESTEKILGSFKKKLAEVKFWGEILPHMETVNRFCHTALLDLDGKAIKDWCSTIHHERCKAQCKGEDGMQSNELLYREACYESDLSNACRDSCDKDWSFEEYLGWL